MDDPRFSDPVILRSLWKAIETVRGQRQIANISRITKVIRKDNPLSPKEILHHIHRAVKDSMVVETISVGCKGSKAGKEQEGYWVPYDIKVDEIVCSDTHDWYCFLCHKPGEMLKCSSCPKSYHKECIKTMFRYIDTTADNKQANLRHWYCEYCQLHTNAAPISNASKKTLNSCLRFVINAMLMEAPELKASPDPKEYIKYNYFIKQHKTLDDLIKACEQYEFESSADFVCMVELIVHNCKILHSEKEDVAVAAIKMLESCNHEIKELELCRTCYHTSNVKPTKDWFCTPCKPPHKLIWAKQKGFEYWPAKVIQVVGKKVDVRFFGGHHERAWIGADSMKSILVSPAELQIKMSKGWTKANEEMKVYIRQTEKLYGSKNAAQIVQFDHQRMVANSAKVKKPVAETKTPVEEYLKQRKKKHHDEIEEFRVRKRKLRNAAGDNEAEPKQAAGDEEQNVKIRRKDEGDEIDITSINMPQPPPSRLLPKWRNELRVLGPKAKLRSECARTWPHASELICAGLLRVAYESIQEQNSEQVNKSTQTKVIELPVLQSLAQHKSDFRTSYLSAGCSCKGRYETVVKQYKACVRKMIKKEKRQMMAASALYIREHLKKNESHVASLEEENAKLKEEIELLRSHNT